MATAPGVCSLKRVPLALLRKELPAIRAEIQRKGREGDLDSAEERELQERIDRGTPDEAVAILESRLSSNPRDLRAMVLLSDAYRSAGKRAAAWEMIKEALQQYPADARAQRLAREIEEEIRLSVPRKEDEPPASLEDVVVLPEGAFEIRPADVSPGAPEGSVPAAEEGPPPPVRTITMADVYWEQGERETARRIVDEILQRDPEDRRALEWKKTHEEKTPQGALGRAPEGALEGAPAGAPESAPTNALAAFLGAIAKEFGYELSGPS
jgi:tetratricopeptide (TPR) repeat protein